MEQYKCEFCENNFASAILLERHKNNTKYCLILQGMQLPKKEKPVFKCLDCNNIFSTKQSLSSHATVCKTAKDKLLLDKDNEIQDLKNILVEKEEEIKNILSGHNIDKMDVLKNIKPIDVNEIKIMFEQQFSDMKFIYEKQFSDFQNKVVSIASNCQKNSIANIEEMQDISDLSFSSEFTNGKNLRVFGTSDNPLFVGKDVAEMLGYSNTREAIIKHVDDEDKITVREYLTFFRVKNK